MRKQRKTLNTRLVAYGAPAAGRVALPQVNSIGSTAAIQHPTVLVFERGGAIRTTKCNVVHAGHLIHVRTTTPGGAESFIDDERSDDE